MSFCYEEAAEAVDRGAVGVGRADAAPAQAPAGQPGSTLGLEPGLFRGHFVDPADRGSVAILAGRVSLAFDLLAAAQAVGRRRRVVECVAYVVGGAG